MFKQNITLLVLLTLCIFESVFAGNNNEDSDNYEITNSIQSNARARNPYYAYINPQVKTTINGMNLMSRRFQAFYLQNRKITSPVAVNVLRRQYPAKVNTVISRPKPTVKSTRNVEQPSISRPMVYRVINPSKIDDFKETFGKPIIYTNPITGGKTIVGGNPLLKTHIKTEASIVDVKPVKSVDLLNKEILPNNLKPYENINTTPMPIAQPQPMPTIIPMAAVMPMDRTNNKTVLRIPTRQATGYFIQQPPTISAKPSVSTINNYQTTPTNNQLSVKIMNDQIPSRSSVINYNPTNTQITTERRLQSGFDDPTKQRISSNQQNFGNQVITNQAVPYFQDTTGTRKITDLRSPMNSQALTHQILPPSTANTGTVTDTNLNNAADFIRAFFGHLMKHFPSKNPYQVASPTQNRYFK